MSGAVFSPIVGNPICLGSPIWVPSLIDIRLRIKSLAGILMSHRSKSARKVHPTMAGQVAVFYSAAYFTLTSVPSIGWNTVQVRQRLPNIFA
jgi:hypothetical protein